MAIPNARDARMGKSSADRQAETAEGLWAKYMQLTEAEA
jgi:hypothetical protein